LLEQHRFSDGLEAAKLAVELEPDSEAAKRLVAEIHLELGKYGDFKKSLDKLNDPATDPSGAVLPARNRRHHDLGSTTAQQIDR